MTVTAVNNTPGRVVWGSGHGLCELGGAVSVNGVWEPLLQNRLCLVAEAEYALEPGEQRTELWLWYGDVLRAGQAVPLPPGNYRVRAEAGAMGWSQQVTISVSGAA